MDNSWGEGLSFIGRLFIIVAACCSKCQLFTFLGSLSGVVPSDADVLKASAGKRLHKHLFSCIRYKINYKHAYESE